MEHAEELNRIAQEKFGKSFDECTAHERIQVGGVKGGQARGGHSADPDRAPPPPDVKFGEDNNRANASRILPHKITGQQQQQQQQQQQRS
ncbi:hypothetical protein TSOC_002082 [Tetrabaena socialis]|uniref:Uncharacterized protein n=1 Tax=Tetrabaena socialis TaxID=47790 RepID=A0A2J8AF22_9CHLO|nr:hypothetical protein TSOC_002082 [Tetrabaena socialis]|eukprot:PNH11123.1 hypothetical protein TSOC_002082 [Tetrabaena socialis]